MVCSIYRRDIFSFLYCEKLELDLRPVSRSFNAAIANHPLLHPAGRQFETMRLVVLAENPKTGGRIQKGGYVSLGAGFDRFDGTSGVAFQRLYYQKLCCGELEASRTPE